MTRFFGLSIVCLLVFLSGCSTKKNTWAHRTYHNTTSYYNVYFNGKEAFKKGLSQIETDYRDDYTKVLPIFPFGNPAASQAGFGEMDHAIKKASKLIKQHSIRVKPKAPKKGMSKKDKAFFKQTEYNKWVDEAYLLMGKAYMHQQEYTKAAQAFNVVLRKFPNTESEKLAYLWLWRNYTEKRDFIQAEHFRNLCVDNAFLKKEYAFDLMAIEASYMLKQQKFDEAEKPLKKALALAKKKYRPRINFILAQLYLKNGDLRRANNLFNEVAKTNNNYEMSFNARLQQALAFDTGASNYKQLIEDLEKLSNDEKNADYLGSIYFAQATVAQKKEKQTEALEYFKKAANAPNSDNNLQAESFLAVAEIYFEQNNYRQSGAYFDSTMTKLANNHPKYTEISTKAKGLTTLANNLLLIEREDSLQGMAKMSEKERDAVIGAAINQIKRQEAEKQRQEALERANSGYDPNNRQQTSTNAFGSGGWYFYNSTSLSYGQNDFKRKWGSRRLADHWRRKNKSVIEAENPDDLAKGEQNKQAAEKDPQKKEFYLQNLPKTAEEFAVSDAKIQEALLQNGNIYRDDINDLQEAIHCYQSLVKRYPKSPFALDAYYNLYIISQQLGKSSKSNYYKNKIIENFPTSNRARALQDPAFASKLKNAYALTEKAYTGAFTAYEQGQPAVALNVISKTLADFPDNHLNAKFAILKAMCYGKMQQIEAYKDGLKAVLKNYPKSKVAPLAQRMLNVAEKGRIDGARVVDEIYFVHPKANYLSALAADTEALANKLMFVLSNFNADYSKTQIITTEKVAVQGGKLFLITMSSFSTPTEAKAHLQAVVALPKVSGHVGASSGFIVDTKNLETLKKDGDLEKYIRFYQDND